MLSICFYTCEAYKVNTDMVADKLKGILSINLIDFSIIYWLNCGLNTK